MMYWCKCSYFRLCFFSYLRSYRQPLYLGRYWGWQMNASFFTTFGLKMKKSIPEDITSHRTLQFQVNVFCLELLREHCSFSVFPNENHMLVTWDLLENSNAVSATWFWLFALTAISREVMKNSEWQPFYYKYYHLGKDIGGEHNEQEQYYLGFFKGLLSSWATKIY